MFYLNTNRAGILFRDARDSEIFVDKSLLIENISAKIRTFDKYICITRPRRFGKTINAAMLAAYYTKGLDSGNLFEALKISEKQELYTRHLNQHNVIYMDFSWMPDDCNSYPQYIQSIRNHLKQDIKETYPSLAAREYDSLGSMLEATGDTFIFILDEWDAIFYEDFMGQEDRAHYLKFIKNLLKDQPYVELAYMTGVLPIAKYGSTSTINMFDEYHFMEDGVYDAFFGFTEEEVRVLCEKHTKVSYEELKQWYDGYRTSDGIVLFNPRSVSRALTRGRCQNYWTETGPMNEVADCIEHNVDEVREDIVQMVAGIPVEVDLQGYSAAELQMNTRDEILSAMVVYGFLSYHDGYLQIPNHELMEKYQRVLSRDSMGGVKEVVKQSKAMVKATLEKDEEQVAALLEEAHDREIPFLQYNDENALSCVITLCYLYARRDYQIEREAKSGKGYCDYLFTPRKAGKPAVILELKVEGTAEEALEQIKAKNYMDKVKHCKDILLVGICYDKQTKRHTCKIEAIAVLPSKK